MRKLLSVGFGCLCMFFAHTQPKPVVPLSQQAKLILPIGHTKDVNWAEFDPIGTKIVTASDDKTAKIWDAQTGLLLASLKGHKDNVLSATFSSDGSRILTYSDDGTAILWNVGNGARINTIRNKTGSIIYAVFSHDARKILTVASDSSIAVWDGAAAQPLFSAKNPDGDLSSAAFSPDGMMIVTTTSHKSEARIWSINGTQLAVKYSVDAHGRELYSATFSPDGRSLLTIAGDSAIKIWDYTARTSRNFKLKDDIIYAGFSPDNRKFVTVTIHNVVKLYNAVKVANQPDNYTYIKSLDGKDGDISALEFSPDSKKMVTSHNQLARVWDVESKDSTPIRSIPFGLGVNRVKFNTDGSKIVTALADRVADVWDAKTGNFLLSLDGHTSATTSEHFSPDGTRIVTSSEDMLARIWDAQTGELKVLLSGHRDIVNSAEFSPDGKRIVTASDDSTTKVWDGVTGRLLATLKGHRAEVSYAQFSPDGLRIVTASADSASQLWRLDAVTKRWTFVKRLTGHKGVVRTALFSPDGLTVLTVSQNKDEIKIWDGNTGMPKGIITSNKTVDLTGIGNEINSVIFSPDSKTILTGSKGMSTTANRGPQLWDAADGHPIESPYLHDSPPQFAMYSPDGQRILYVSQNDDYIVTVDAKNFQSPIVLQRVPGNELINDAAFSPDGTKIILSFTDNTARVWNAITGKEIAVLTGHNDDVVTARFSSDGKYVLTSSDDNTLKKWETNKWQLLYTFFPVDSSDYLVLDKFNRWDGSPAARALLYVTCGLEVINLEQFEDLGWEPGLIKKVLGLNPEPIKAKKLSEISLCNYTPVVRKLGYNQGSYWFTILSRDGGVGEIQLYVNDKLVKVYDPTTLRQNQNVYEFAVTNTELQPYFSSGRSNQVSVIATTADHTMTSRGGVGINTEVTAKSLANPNLYLVSVGINNYAGEKMKLNYASTDAVSFSSALTASARKLLGADHVKTVTFSTEPGSKNWPSKDLIKKTVENIAQTATADDILVFFFAGHGKVPDGQKNFYLLTAGSTSFDLVPGENKEAISTDELNLWMRNIKAHKQVLILDACQSGQAIENLQSLVARGEEIPADQVRALEHLKDNAGTFILSASSSSQSAYENPEYGQGLLTYSLLSGIKNQDALTANKFIDISKWFNAAKTNVSDMAKASRKVQEPQIIGAASYSVGLVDQEVINGITLAGRKKIISRSTLSEANNRFYRDNLQLAKEVDNQLNELSAMGAASPFSFIETNSTNDAYSVTGKYEVKGNIVTVSAALFLGSKDQPEIEINKTGTVDNRAALAKSIVDAVAAYLKGK